MLPLAVLAWAAHLGWLDLDGGLLAWLGHGWAPWILTALALGELVVDLLQATPSRKVPMQFGARLVVGAAAGAALALGMDASWLAGLMAGVVGAFVGTVVGPALRANLAKAFGRDWPAALLEDVVAVGGALMIMLALG